MNVADQPDPDFLDLRDHRDDRLLELIHAKNGLYERSFPLKEERETLKTHREALWGEGTDGPDDSPILHFIVASIPGGPPHVVGFAAAEYYAASKCGLLSYIAVEASQRGKPPHIGRMLVEKAVRALHEDARAAGHSLEATFGEIHDPAKARLDGDSMKPLDRVRVMHALGARRVPIPYVQPALGENRKSAQTLMLVAFPIDGSPVEKLDPKVVRDFLTDLYSALEVPRLEQDVDLIRSLDGLRGATIELAELVSQEKPVFVDPAPDDRGPKIDAQGGIRDYGIAIHLVLKPAREPRRARWKLRRQVRDVVAAELARDDEADPLRSFEEDILAYADPGSDRRAGPPTPFSTHAPVVPREWALVSVTFPDEVVFRSEGRLVPLRLDRDRVIESERSLRFLLRASRTDFHRSKLSVLHLVLGPDPSDNAPALNEYDLIKLMKLWQPSEGVARDGTDATPVDVGKRHPFVTFDVGTGTNAVDGTGPDEALQKLAEEVFQLKRERRAVDIDGPRAGTVQVVHSCFKKHGVENGNICSDIEGVLDEEGAVSPSGRLKALGGLVCGLLDFAEIDGDELADVFRETDHDEQSVRSFHKGTLFVASAGDRAFDAEGIRNSVGLSPYLLIPHAVLLHNQWWLAKAVEQLDYSRRRRGSGKLETIRTDVATTLSRRLVPNVFHYHDERSLYEKGSNARGLGVRERVVRERLADMAHKIHARHDSIRDFIGVAIAVILGVFTLGDTAAKHSTSYFIVRAAVTAALLVALLVALFWSEDDDGPAR